MHHGEEAHQILDISILLTAVFLGSLLGYFLMNKKSWSKLILTFSGAYFLGMTVIEIFPTVYTKLDAKTAGILVLMGVLVQILLESISKGAEHGHIHLKKNGLFPMSVFIGLFLHAFIEGMPISHYHSHDLLWAIVVHKIPVAMILFVAISQITASIWKRVAFMIVFAFASPIGYLLGNTFLADYAVETTAFVAGIFLHVASVILFESSENHRFNFKKMLALIIGFGMAFLTLH